MNRGIPINALEDGDMAPCRIDGIEVLLCRAQGRYFAVSSRCPHAGQPLNRGRLRGFELSCPLHGARFDVRDGSCLAGPAESGLARYPVVVEGGKVHVRVT